MRKLLLTTLIASLTTAAIADDQVEHEPTDAHDEDCTLTIHFPKGDDEQNEEEEFEWWDGHATDFYYGNLNAGYTWKNGTNVSNLGISLTLGESIYVQADANTATDVDTKAQSDGTRFGIGARFDMAENLTMHVLWDNNRFKDADNYWGLEGGVVGTVLNEKLFAAANARANFTLPETTFSGELEAGIRPEDWLSLSAVVNENPDQGTTYGIRGRIGF